jgi:hypothetical protein
MNKIVLFFLLAVLVACDKKVGKIPTTAPATPAPANFCDSIKFNKYIKTIITSNCATPGCHTSGFPSGDFTGYTGIKIKVDNGTFKTRVFNSPSNPMPQNGMLPQGQLDSIKCWLDRGSPND